MKKQILILSIFLIGYQNTYSIDFKNSYRNLMNWAYTKCGYNQNNTSNDAKIAASFNQPSSTFPVGIYNKNNECFKIAPMLSIFAYQPKIATSILEKGHNYSPNNKIFGSLLYNLVQEIHNQRTNKDLVFNAFDQFSTKLNAVAHLEIDRQDDPSQVILQTQELLGKNYFTIKEHTTLTCNSCLSSRNRSAETNPVLSIPLEGPHLVNSLNKYFEKEKLVGENAVKCSMCNDQTTEHLTQKQILQQPEFLCLWLKRFNNDLSKNNTHLKFPLANLSLDQWSKSKNGYVYDLTGILVHRGNSPTSGHYVSYFRQQDPINEIRQHPLKATDVKWYYQNDDKIETKDHLNIFLDIRNGKNKSETPYFLLYKKRYKNFDDID